MNFTVRYASSRDISIAKPLAGLRARRTAGRYRPDCDPIGGARPCRAVAAFQPAAERFDRAPMGAKNGPAARETAGAVICSEQRFKRKFPGKPRHSRRAPVIRTGVYLRQIDATPIGSSLARPATAERAAPTSLQAAVEAGKLAAALQVLERLKRQGGTNR